MGLQLQNVSKDFGGVAALKSINLDIPQGELVVFVGPSGCGKSTLLRIIAGLESVSAGTIAIDGKAVNTLEPVERGVAMVFQSYALYPHMTVRKNMSFSLKIAGLKKDEITRKVEQAAASLEIDQLLDRLPKELSGGQRQRVAVGRSIVRDPRIFLFDEPLSNLDAALRTQTRVEIAHLHKKLDSTIIYVTHDQVEAMTLADRIVVINSGQIEQVGHPKELYDQPRNMFVAGFIGSPRMNFIPVDFDAEEDRSMIKSTDFEFALPVSLPKSGSGTLGIRPENIRLVESAQGCLTAHVILEEFLGDHQILYMQSETGVNVTAKVHRGFQGIIDPKVGISFDPDSVHLFDANGINISLPESERLH